MYTTPTRPVPVSDSGPEIGGRGCGYRGAESIETGRLRRDRRERSSATASVWSMMRLEAGENWVWWRRWVCRQSLLEQGVLPLVMLSILLVQCQLMSARLHDLLLGTAVCQ